MVDIKRNADDARRKPEYTQRQLVVVCDPKHPRYDMGGRIKKRIRASFRYVVKFKADSHEEEFDEADIIAVDHLPENYKGATEK